jgi:hypothetical protein
MNQDDPGRWALAALLVLAFLPCASAFAEQAARAEGPAAVASEALPAAAKTPEAILEAAFVNRYEVDTIYDLELVTDGPRGHAQRRLHTVTKIVDGRSHSIGRLTEPATVRGMTVMILETEDGDRDTFVYLPALKRGRRISGAQRSDAFLGTELNFEDFERQRASDFALERLPDEEIDSETCAVIRGVPREPAAYEKVDFAVAADGAILEYLYWKAGGPDPYRVIRAPREHMKEAGGHLLPTRFSVTNVIRRITTDAVIHAMDVSPEIDPRLFSMRTLEQERALPKIRKD